MQNENVAQLIIEDVWSLVQGERESGPFLLRYRQPVLQASDVNGYVRCLRIVWAYAAENSGTLPEEHAQSAMNSFENRLCEALEYDALAVLVAVLTFDGARQWIFYTSDISECGQRINTMPQEEDAYPVELDAFDDSAWEYLREQILSNIDVETA